MTTPTDKTDALVAQLTKLCSWKHLMSYNEAYFGEPEGELKSTVYAIERNLPLATPAAVTGEGELRAALEFCADEFRDKSWVAECRGDISLQRYYTDCSERVTLALASHPAAGSEALETALRDYEFAAYEHGKTDDNAAAVDAAGEKLRAMLTRPPAAATVPEGFEEAFQLVFSAYGTPADTFGDDAAWAMSMLKKVTAAFSRMQKIRASLAAPPPPVVVDGPLLLDSWFEKAASFLLAPWQWNRLHDQARVMQRAALTKQENPS